MAWSVIKYDILKYSILKWSDIWTFKSDPNIRTPNILNIFISKYISRHNSVYFFDIRISRHNPNPWYIYYWDFQICFAPQRRAFFQDLNCQKGSGAGIFCICSFGKLLRATTACKFPSLIWPAGSAPATLASLVFDPPEPQIIGKLEYFVICLSFCISVFSFFWFFLFWSSLF